MLTTIYKIIQSQPLEIVILLALIVCIIQIMELKKRIDSLKTNCEARLLWCIDHFDMKE